MKTLITVLLLAITFAGCQTPPAPANPTQNDNPDYTESFLKCSSDDIYWLKTEKQINGMTYIFITNYEGGSIAINLTQDSLNCALLRKNLRNNE